MHKDEELCNRRLQAQINEPLHENRTRRKIKRFDAIARLSVEDRRVVCEELPVESTNYIELKVAYLNSKKDTQQLMSTIMEKNNGH